MSGGTWTEADTRSPGTRPGIYINLVTQARRQLEGGAGTVCVVGTADWGPMDVIRSVASEEDLYDAFGQAQSLPLLAAQALRGGAANVLALRIGGAAAKKAAGNLVDTEGSPANVIKITARNEGARGNNFTITTRTSGAGLVIEITEGGIIIETIITSADDDASVIAAINRSSAFIDAEQVGNAGRDVDAQTVALSDGASGTTLVAADYTAAQGIAQAAEFDTYVQGDDTTAANQDAASDWADAQRADGNRFIVVMGGAGNATITAAIARAKALDSMSTVYVFPGFVDTDEVTYTGQQAAARVAGMIAAAGISRAITWQMIDDAVRPTSVVSSAEISDGLEAGVLLITANRAGTRLSRGLTTRTTRGAEGDMSKIRTVATVDAIAEGLERGITPYIGAITNDEDGRRSLAAVALAYLEQLVSAGAIQEGPVVIVRSGASDQVFLRIQVALLDSIEEVFIVVRLGE